MATANFGLVWALPFVGILLTIAAAPSLAPGPWQRHYGKAALFWGLAFIVPDIAYEGWRGAGIALFDMVLHQYGPFVILLGSLYVVAGGLRVTGTPRGTPGVNTAMLGIGTAMAGVIGTPGAALLMLRPLIRANLHRRQATHVFVFFILLVANIGGALTPIGNTPLFLGYLKGVPFFWPSLHLAAPTVALTAGLLATFYALERYLGRARRETPETVPEIETLGVEGRINLVLLACAIMAILLRVFWSDAPSFHILSIDWNLADCLTDALLLAIGFASYALTPQATRRANDFTWGALVEVAILFAAIFVTLMPVTAMMAAGANGPAAPFFAAAFVHGVPDNAFFYRATGTMSALLDNAPTYLLFFGLAGDDPARLVGPLAKTLAAISAGACFWGGLTYLGNAPNLMVRSIVESHGIRMPSFIGYIGWAAVCLVPWLLLIEAIFLD